MNTAFFSHSWRGPALAVGLMASVVTAQDAMFPYVMPWDDAAPGLANVSGWLTAPAGKLGPVTVSPDGHFAEGGKRIRFFGVNLCMGAVAPQKEHAEIVAKRLAKFGINVVRFHHMDTGAWPRGIRSAQAADTGTLEPQALDRLDYLLAQLKAQGIYANINLLVGRPFKAADGLPPEIEKIDWKDRHIAAFYLPRMLELQKEYARKLLGHTNAYTGLSAAADPAVAFVEINNENGLVHAWLGGDVDQLPAVFQAELGRQWNAWLTKRYATTAALRAAWAAGAEPVGAELLANANLAHNLAKWTQEKHEQAQMDAAVTDEVPAALRGANARAVRLSVRQAGKEAWHLQFNQGGLALESGRAYTASFWARANQARRVAIAASQAHSPWGNLGLSGAANVTTQWQRFTFVFRATQMDTNARISFSGLGAAGAVTELAGFSLRPGGVQGLMAGEQLEGNSVAWFEKARAGQRTEAAARDWLQFLTETEDYYWQEMQRFLKQDLQVRGLVTGTIVGCAPVSLMAKTDWVDTHSYWQHPNFPVRPWDSEEWIVNNRTMVNERGGTLPGLALKRVAGKPHACTEYNHPAPNTYAAEGALLLAAYAALQDWDAIYLFSWSHSGSETWNGGKIGSFFDVDQHPAKLATLAAAGALFTRGDLQAARQCVAAALPAGRERDLLRKASAWSLVDGGTVGIAREASLVHRVALVTDGVRAPAGALKPEDAHLAGSRFEADTGELVWDLTDKARGVVTVNSPHSQGVIGYGGGKTYKLGTVTIAPGQGMQDGWSIIMVTDFSSGPGGGSWLITAVGQAMNTDMVWKNAEKSSVGRKWGKAPSLVEGVPGQVTLGIPAARAEAWALDACGQRARPLALKADAAGHAVLTLGPENRALWYEVRQK